MFCYEKKRSGLYDYQDHYEKHVDLKYAEIKIRAEFEKKKHARKEKVNREFEQDLGLK